MLGVGIGLTDAATRGFHLAAPLLDWDDDTADTTPDFLVDFDEAAAVAGTVVTLQIDDDSAFGSPSETTHALDAADIIAGTITMAGSALASGTYYARVKVNGSAWSNTETIMIATSTFYTTFLSMGQY